MEQRDNDLELQLRELGNIAVPDSLLKNIQARLGQFTPEWAERQYQLAHESRKLSEGDHGKNLTIAVAHLQNVLHVYTSTTFPLQRFQVLYDLGCTYCDLSELPEKDRLTNLEAAVTSYKEALDVVREHHLADEWIDKLDKVISECYRQQLQELEYRANAAKKNADDSLNNHQLASALDHYVQALDLYGRLESRTHEAIVLKDIESIQCSLQNMDAAISMGKEVALYRKAVEANSSHMEGTDSRSHQSRSAVLDRPVHNETIVRTSDDTPPLPNDPNKKSDRDRHIPRTDKIFPKRRTRRWWIPCILLILIILVGASEKVLFRRGGDAMPTTVVTGTCATATNTLTPSGIGVVKTDAGECIGLSDGTVAFDVNQLGRTDSALKQQAAEKLAMGDRKDAIDLLQQAIKQDRSDAEARIYLENQRVLNTGLPYITLIIGTKITGENINPTGERNNLQGAYIAQQEHNNNCTPPHCIPVRLLIANTGNDANNAKNVAQQIVQAAQSDHTIIGVEGWSVSQDSVNVVSVLSVAGLPMVSPAASSDSLTSISPYFFRVSPTDSSQGALGASYAMNTLHAQRIALFVDPSNAYSSSLANAFKQHITSGNIDLETYTVGTYAQNKDLAHGNLQDVLSYRPDLIYFAGYPKDAEALLEELQSYQQLAQIPVMGGDALEDLVSDPSQNVVGLNHLVFTDFAAPDEWHYIDPSVQEPPFFQEYTQIFSSGDNAVSGAAMLSYDAMRVLFQASQTAKAPLTGASLREALTNITGSQAFQGISGQIAFGQDGNPQDKAVVILNVDKQGKAHILGTEGTFLLPQAR